jgi:putative transposase
VKTIADALGVARSNLGAQAIAAPRQRRGRRPQPDAELLAEIKEIIAGMPTYGYRRVPPHPATPPRTGWGGGQRQAALPGDEGTPAAALERHTGTGAERRHDGRVAVDRSDARWCSDSFEIGCDPSTRHIDVLLRGSVKA